MHTIARGYVFEHEQTGFEPAYLHPDVMGELVCSEMHADAGRHVFISDFSATFARSPETSREPVRLSVPEMEPRGIHAADLRQDLIHWISPPACVHVPAGTSISSSPTTATDIGTLSEMFRREASKAKASSLIRLLDEWLADESGYDEETWPAVKEGIEASRLSGRKRFRA
jgi:hypothetical protein